MNHGEPAIAARPASKKKASKKLRSEIMTAKLAKLNANSSKRRDRRKHVVEKKVVADIVTEATTQHKANVDDKESIVAKAHVLLMLGLCRPSSVILSGTAMVVTSIGSSAVRPTQH
ncbi:hypothetical protein D1007_23430 [Hordeum vulgare]|nr:hypothetical protein D1007_23430 [Hordeum vulgare]